MYSGGVYNAAPVRKGVELISGSGFRICEFIKYHKQYWPELLMDSWEGYAVSNIPDINRSWTNDDLDHM